ncbi:hypothetical protein PR048_015108 [Dryococelus australis]|uniref:Recombination activating protein 1 n=1 Tax=Dryococelus australis TaxID=614101 RepID=A0ABQ9HGJ2_9NEOP|nr:hypothetical protein PR048_015108 [Dryococelus australis]
MYCNAHHISDVERLLNSCWHEGTGSTPLELMNMGCRDSKKCNITKVGVETKRQRRKWDKSIQPIVFEEGDEVLVATHHVSSLVNKQIPKFS